MIESLSPISGFHPMPTELFRIDRPLTWLRTVIRRRTFGVETEFHFNVEGSLISIAMGRMVEAEFLNEVMETKCLKILEHDDQARKEPRSECFEICINYGDDLSTATVRGPFVRYGPLEAPTDSGDAD